MSARALLIAGGWREHRPRAAARILAAALVENGCDVDLSFGLSPLDDGRVLSRYALVVPVWTNGRLSANRAENLCLAVSAGTGLAGFHGAADGFRSSPQYQFLFGGQFVAHPGNDGVAYTVHITRPAHPVTCEAIDFEVCTERYYLHVDPSNDVLAETPVPRSDGNGAFTMPVAWTRVFGRGRVFYSSLGHSPEVLQAPHALRLLTRGCLWASRQDQLLKAAG